MARPIQLKTKVVESEYLNEKTLLITFSLIDPSGIDHKPGQFVAIEVGEFTYRSYSIISDSPSLDEFQIVLTVAHDGVGANYLKALNPGDEVNMVGPRGKFFFVEPPANNILLLATSTGIAPYISFLHKLVNDNFSGNVSLLWGHRTKEELYFEDLLETFKEELPNFDYEIYLSQEDQEGFEKGRITRDLAVVADDRAHYYLCGNPDMVSQASIKLLENEIPESNIFYEKFTWALEE